jgi:hypothetical protein
VNWQVEQAVLFAKYKNYFLKKAGLILQVQTSGVSRTWGIFPGDIYKPVASILICRLIT